SILPCLIAIEQRHTVSCDGRRLLTPDVEIGRGGHHAFHHARTLISRLTSSWYPSAQAERPVPYVQSRSPPDQMGLLSSAPHPGRFRLGELRVIAGVYAAAAFGEIVLQIGSSYRLRFLLSQLGVVAGSDPLVTIGQIALVLSNRDSSLLCLSQPCRVAGSKTL